MIFGRRARRGPIVAVQAAQVCVETRSSDSYNRLIMLAPVTGTEAESATAPASQPAVRLPNGLKPLFDYPVRDTSVCLVDGVYYLTGTMGAPTWWKTNEGVRIWKSKDLKQWRPLGLVWSFDR